MNWTRKCSLTYCEEFCTFADSYLQLFDIYSNTIYTVTPPPGRVD